MHHDLNPPIAHSKVNSKLIMLTDDYAAKVHTYIYIYFSSLLLFSFIYMLITKTIDLFQLAEVTFRSTAESAKPTRGDSKKSEMTRAALDNNVYDFGILLLEIISGKLPQSEEQGNLVNWVSFKGINIF
jgi:hypothetical protein